MGSRAPRVLRVHLVPRGAGRPFDGRMHAVPQHRRSLDGRQSAPHVDGLRFVPQGAVGALRIELRFVPHARARVDFGVAEPPGHRRTAQLPKLLVHHLPPAQ